MANYRMNRVNEEVQKELGNILNEIKDPRIARSLVFVTAVQVSKDLKFAKVYYSTLKGGHEKDVAEGLKSASGFIRSQIAERLNMRATPAFTFIKDDSAENGAHISQLLKTVEKDLQKEEEI